MQINLFQTYYRGEVNIDQKTPDGEAYKRYQYPHIFGSRVNRGDEELVKSKYPSMLGVIEDESDVGSRCYSRQSSVVSQWEDRIMSGDEDGGSISRTSASSPTTQASQTVKDLEFNFHDISKAIPENIRHQKQLNTESRAEDLDEKVFHFNDNDYGDSSFINGLVNDARRTEHGSPKVRKHVVQLGTLNGHPTSLQSLQKPSWAVAAGGVQNLDPKDREQINSSEQKFYLMETSNNLKDNNDPNLCDTLDEATDNQNVFENCRIESDEQFKKCTNNGWNEKDSIKNNDNEVNNCRVQNGLHNGSEDTVNEDERITPNTGDEPKNDDFSYDPRIKEMHNMKEPSKEISRTETINQFSPDKSAELFLKSLISDTEVLPDKSEGPIWILPPDEGTKKKNKKKKKPRA